MNRAFTLLEVMVVLALLGVLAGIGAVALPRSRADAADRLLAALESAQLTAIRTGRSVEWRDSLSRVVFRPDGSSSGARLERGAVLITVDPLTGQAVRVAR